MRTDILVPVGRVDKFLEPALDSVRDQLGARVRLVVVDNTINQGSVLKKLLKSRDSLVVQEKRGFAHALNAPLEQGFDFSEYVALMNSDDLSHPNRIATQIKILIESGADLNICNVVNFSGTKKIQQYFGNPNYVAYHPILLAFGAYGLEPMWCGTREWWLKSTFRNTALHHDVVDLECGLKTFHKTHLSTTSEYLYFYRKHSAQISQKMAKKEHFEVVQPLLVEMLKSYGIASPSPDVLWLNRPRNFLVEKISIEDKDELLQFQRSLLHYAINEIAQEEIAKMILEFSSIRIGVMRKSWGLKRRIDLSLQNSSRMALSS
jgi:glycosyltransferase involved in cell wall biosynthesis